MQNVFYFFHNCFLNAGVLGFFHCGFHNTVNRVCALFSLVTFTSKQNPRGIWQKEIGVEVILSSKLCFSKSAEGQTKRSLKQNSLFFPYDGLGGLYARDSLLSVLLKSAEDRSASALPCPGRGDRDRDRHASTGGI